MRSLLALACVVRMCRRIVARGAGCDVAVRLPAAARSDSRRSSRRAQLYHTLQNSSFMYRKLPPEAEPRELQINDIITVLVDYRSSMMSEGDAEARKNGELQRGAVRLADVRRQGHLSRAAATGQSAHQRLAEEPVPHRIGNGAARLS